MVLSEVLTEARGLSRPEQLKLIRELAADLLADEEDGASAYVVEPGGAMVARAGDGARQPTFDELSRVAAAHPPPQSWYDEDWGEEADAR